MVGVCYQNKFFFPMSGESNGWSKLAKSLKAEIDEDLIEAYRGIESRFHLKLGKTKKLRLRLSTIGALRV